MGRRISDKGYQGLVESWRVALVSMRWGADDAVSKFDRLAVAIGVDRLKISSAHRRRMKAAFEKLGAALSAADPGGASEARPDELDGWIERHLIRRGADLLISEDVRRIQLARQRDARRRSRHSDAGLHSARIEMPMANWEKLTAIQSHLEKKAGKRDAPAKNIGLGMALAQVIDAYEISSPIARTRKTPQRGTESSIRQPDLLEPLSVLKASRKAQ